MIIFGLYKMSSCLVSIRHKISDHDRIDGHLLKCFSAMNPHGLFFRAVVLKQGVTTHLCVAVFFSGVSPKIFESSFRGKIMQICHLNIKIMVFCHRYVQPKIILWKVCHQPKKVENHCFRAYVLNRGSEERVKGILEDHKSKVLYPFKSLS